MIDLNCQKCPLSKTRKCVVAGDGSLRSRYMVVGIAPGADEDTSGVPFVGAAGKELDFYLKLAGLSRDEVYVTNTVKCRPPLNRNPHKVETTACRPYLQEELDLINPDVVITLGAPAAEWFDVTLVQHGLPIRRGTRLIVPMYHPAAALHNPRIRPTIESDWRALPDKLHQLEAPHYSYGDKLLATSPLAFDTETTGVDADTATIVCVSASSSPEYAYVGDLEHRLVKAIENAAITKIAHNYKYEYKILTNLGIKPVGFTDTMLMAYVLGEKELGLKTLALKYCNRQLGHANKLLEEAQLEKNKQFYASKITYFTPPLNKTQTKRLVESIETGKAYSSIIKIFGEPPIATMLDVPKEKLLPYSAGDAVATLELYNALKPKIEAEGLQRILDIEVALVPVLAEMERKGLLIDIVMLQQLKQEWQSELDLIRSRYPTINLNAHAQKLELLQQNGVNVESTRKKELVGAKPKTPQGNVLVADLLRYSELSKLVTTYTTGIIEKVDSGGRVHPEFNQVRAEGDDASGATATGRISSRRPNFQNLPGRTEDGKKVRSTIIAPQEHVLVSFDYDQIEMLIMYYRAGQTNMLSSYAAGGDAHTDTARFMYPGFHPDCVEDSKRCESCSTFRKNAKNVNFCVGYGGSEYKIAETGGISLDEAKLVKERYFRTFPNIAKYIEETKATAREQGWTSTLWGRKRWEPAIFSFDRSVKGAAERELLNHTIQGTAADLIKEAMVSVYNSGQTPICQVHDELLFEVPDEQLDNLIPMVINCMQTMELGVPIRIHVKVGKSWAEMKDV